MKSIEELKVLLDQCCGTCTEKHRAIELVNHIEQEIKALHYQECLWGREIGEVTGGCDTPEEAAKFIARIREQAQLS
ncbi:hypothetical protein [Vibrio harveyi]|uniref:hypothetical protein n=1 Tax=Vibrio harveyi TaxID=669 RepID=UPI00217DE89F|nr:hypothetical protein [Vibrio harveyi]